MSNPYRVYASCRIYSLPVDIIDYIWSKNHAWAANVIQTRFKSYAQRCILLKVYELQKLMCFAGQESNLGYHMQNYNLLYIDRVYKKSDVFATCRMCKCCARHQINKPTHMRPIGWFIGSPLTLQPRPPQRPFHGTDYTACECSCRRMARFLCV